jgi:hypothetical protein
LVSCRWTNLRILKLAIPLIVFLITLGIELDFDSHSRQDFLELLVKRSRTAQTTNLEQYSRIPAVMIRIDSDSRQYVVVCGE